ncbi:MAG TPA: NAD-dependent epimerase/dehydratase family protein [Terriglobales bacterium]|nr:NAD-dependent epimerase/dehydratase family protein [Terriglobales bacterium]
MDRRDFIKYSLMATAASACSLFPLRAFASAPPRRILVLGGTSFLGPALVEASVAAGHTVTLFNRGITNPELFPHLEKLRGFRSSDAGDQDLSSLARRHFDVIVDVWPNDPAVVASAAEFLKDRAPHYLYVSSVAAYDGKEFTKAGIEENAPLETWDGPGQKYNRGKAESERRLHAILGERLTIVRPGPIKGDRDTTPDLFAWLTRAQNGGRHIGPGDGSDPVELVDVKDVARFLVFAIDRSLYGAFNLTGRTMTFREFLNACKAVTRSDAEFVWVPQDFLHQHQLETDFTLGLFAGNFPFWRPSGAHPGLYQISSEKAFRAGWQTRPFEETALDCLTSFRSQGENLDWTDYLSADKEKQVLDAWTHHSS